MPGSFERQGFEPCDSGTKMQGSKPCRSKSYHVSFEELPFFFVGRPPRT